MARAIDADRLADGLKLHRQPTDQKHEADRQWAVGYNAGLDRALHSIAYAPTLTQPNEWVAAEERLPTDERPVLVFVGYADTMTGFITTSSYFCFDANPHWQWDGLVRDEQRTLFWMPLPAPPERRPPEGKTDA